MSYVLLIVGRKKARLPSPNGPSRVVHIRNISSGIDETDVIQLGLPFGKVSNILMLKQKNQVLLSRDRTMVRNKVKLRHQNSHFPTSEGVSEVSERANE